MKRILIFLMVLPVICQAGFIGIVNNNGTAPADSMTMPFVVLDSLGQPKIALAANDSIFLFVRFPSGAIAFQDTLPYNGTNILETSAAGIYSHGWKAAVADIDGGTAEEGAYAYDVIVKDASLVLATPNHGTFQLYAGANFDIVLDFLDQAISGIDADVWTVASRQLTALDENVTSIDLDGITIATATNLTTNNDKTGYALSVAGIDGVVDTIFNRADVLDAALTASDSAKIARWVWFASRGAFGDSAGTMGDTNQWAQVDSFWNVAFANAFTAGSMGDSLNNATYVQGGAGVLDQTELDSLLSAAQNNKAWSNVSLADSAIDSASIKSNTIQASKIQADAIGASELAASATDEIGDTIFARTDSAKASNLVALARQATLIAARDSIQDSLNNYYDWLLTEITSIPDSGVVFTTAQRKGILAVLGAGAAVDTAGSPAAETHIGYNLNTIRRKLSLLDSLLSVDVAKIMDDVQPSTNIAKFYDDGTSYTNFEDMYDGTGYVGGAIKLGIALNAVTGTLDSNEVNATTFIKGWNTPFNTSFTAGSMGDSLNNSSYVQGSASLTAAEIVDSIFAKWIKPGDYAEAFPDSAQKGMLDWLAGDSLLWASLADVFRNQDTTNIDTSDIGDWLKNNISGSGVISQTDEDSILSAIRDAKAWSELIVARDSIKAVLDSLQRFTKPQTDTLRAVLDSLQRFTKPTTDSLYALLDSLQRFTKPTSDSLQAILDSLQLYDNWIARQTEIANIDGWAPMNGTDSLFLKLVKIINSGGNALFVQSTGNNGAGARFIGHGETGGIEITGGTSAGPGILIEAGIGGKDIDGNLHGYLIDPATDDSLFVAQLDSVLQSLGYALVPVQEKLGGYTGSGSDVYTHIGQVPAAVVDFDTSSHAYTPGTFGYDAAQGGISTLPDSLWDTLTVIHQDVESITATVPDSLLEMVTRLKAWPDSLGDTLTAIHAAIAAVACGGAGSEACSLTVTDTASTAMYLARIEVWTLTQSSKVIDAVYTDVNGLRIVNLDTTSYYLVITKQGYNQYVDTITVTQDSTWTFELTPFTNGTCEVTGIVYNLQNEAESGATVEANLNSDSLRVGITYNDGTIDPRHWGQKAKTNTSGAFSLNLIPNSLLSDPNSTYNITITYRSGATRVLRYVVIPAQTTVDIGNL